MQTPRLRPAYSVDDSRFPLVIMAATENVTSDDALDVTYQLIEALLERRCTFGIMIDLRGSISTPARRRRLREWRDRNAIRIRPVVAALAVVAETQIERGFVTAVLWLMTPAIPMKVFTERSDAAAWLMAFLK